jgi:hypothetical protein
MVFGIGKAKSKYKAIFLQKAASGYIELDSCIPNISEKTFSYKGHSYEIKLENELYTTRSGQTILFYESEGSMLTFKQAKALMTAKELDEFVEQNIFGQLARSLRESLSGINKSWLIPIILGCAIGIGIGYMVGQNYNQHTVIQFVNQTQTGIQIILSRFRC